MGSPSEPTWRRGHVAGDSSRTHSSSPCRHFQWHKPPVGSAASKESSGNTAGEAAYLPSRLLPQNSCDPFNPPHDFSKLPPAPGAGSHLLCPPRRCGATSNFAFGRSRTHTPGSSSAPALGGTDPRTPQSSLQVQAHRNFQLVNFQLTCWLSAPSVSTGPLQSHRTPVPTGLPIFQERYSQKALRWLRSDPLRAQPSFHFSFHARYFPSLTQLSRCSFTSASPLENPRQVCGFTLPSPLLPIPVKFLTSPYPNPSQLQLQSQNPDRPPPPILLSPSPGTAF